MQRYKKLITELYGQYIKIVVLLVLMKICMSLWIESSAIINLRGVSKKLNKYIVFTMQTYKKLNM